MAMIHFLLVYDVKEQRLVSQDSFDNANVATAEYAKAEAEHRFDKGFEIVLVGADSIETIMRTHGHYFEERALERSPYLSAV